MTDEERRERDRKKYMAILKKNPNCVWARNELKYLDEELRNVCPINEMSGAYRADAAYHGGYVE